MGLNHLFGPASIIYIDVRKERLKSFIKKNLIFLQSSLDYILFRLSFLPRVLDVYLLVKTTSKTIDYAL